MLQVKLIRLVGIMLIFYVREEHAEYISDVEVESVGTGIMGRMVRDAPPMLKCGFDFLITTLSCVSSG